MERDDEQALLAQLRAVFREELADHLATLERESVALARPEAEAEALRRSIGEIYRAAHSLKGAARAVGERGVERLCHRLESALAPMRGERGELAAAAARVATDEAVAALRASIATPPPAGARAARALPATVEPPAAPDTVRVPTARLATMLRIGEELAFLGGSRNQVRERFAELDGALETLRRELAAVRRAVTGTPVATTADAALAAYQTIAVWANEQRRSEQVAWSRVSARAGQVVDHARRLRVVPFDTLGPALERAALETARDVDKRVTFELTGGASEIDRRVLERLRDPLVHLIRNAVDHGIESAAVRRATGKAEAGSVRVEVRQRGTEVAVMVGDDGAGFDLEALRRAGRPPQAAPDTLAEDDAIALAFRAGVTTRGAPTAISGRGVGLDVVRQQVAELQGRVVVDTEPGAGARVSLVVPADLGVSRALLVRAGAAQYALVETAIVRLVRAGESDRRSVEGRAYLRDEGDLVPLADLGQVLGLHGVDAARKRCPCVVLASGEQRAAFAVDELLDAREVVIAPLSSRVRRAAFVTGATVLGGGELALVLDAAHLVACARPGRIRRAAAAEEPARPRILVVDDSVTTRQLLRAILEARGWEVTVASDGQRAWDIIVRGESVDLVVSDVDMPNLDGLQLLGRVRNAARTAHLPVVLVTALGSDEDRRRAVDLGADAYIVKGRFDQRELIDTIAELLE